MGLDGTAGAVAPVVAAMAASAVALLVPAAPRLDRGPAPDETVRARRGSLLLRLRVPLVGFVIIGCWVFLGGGVGGLLAALLAGGGAWNVLGRAEDPARARERRELDRDLPGAVDLLVLGLSAGAAPGPVLRMVAAAMDGPVAVVFGTLAQRLEVGTDPEVVWRDLARHDQLSPLGRALGRAHASGASVTEAGRQLAEELHDRSRAEVEGRARGVAARAAAPLGVCFLPAFVLLGIVPLIAGLVSGLDILG